ncbi:Protein SHI RELATED SEQUENCE 3 [Hirschfeldia incana]|nr:Protein SHI RELATED SEQUENCE 3 [Hirschfeldia incana]
MGRRCEDCGNQAKKECVYMRCRTCCKTKAFHCQTHIKSTWVPAYRRSQKQLLQTQTQPQEKRLSTISPKRLREHQPSSSPSSSGVRINTTTGHFPVELSSVADFRCVKVSSIEDGKEQYAYQTTVNIGGHVFRGILHDQGLEKVVVDHQSTHHYDPHHHQLHNKHHDQELLPPSSSSCPSMITSPFTDFMSGTRFSSHQKS